MLRLFRRPFRSEPVHAGAEAPLDRLISLWLALAYAEGATAIVIGISGGRPGPLGGEHEADAVLPPAADRMSRALAASSRLKSAAGWQFVPVWVRIGGELQPMMGPPPEALFPLLSLIQQRLLSLDASADDPKPMRFVEYDSDDPSERRFAEIELFLDADNTIRIEVLRHLRLPVSVRAVPSVY